MNKLEDPNALAELLGNYWTELHDDKELISAILRAKSELEVRNFRDLETLVESQSRFTVPLARRVRWHSLKIYQDELSYADAVSYGSGYVYGSQPTTGETVLYGRPKDRSVNYPADTDLENFHFICDQIVTPTTILVNGLDVFLDAENSRILFAEDPFDGGFAVETEDGRDFIILWLYEVDLTRTWVQDLYGAAVKLSGASTESFRNAVNGFLDSIVGGTSDLTINEILSAVCDTPLAKDYETVEVIYESTGRRQVITDKNVYEVNPDSTLLVSVGDSLSPGEWLDDTLKVYAPNSGSYPTAEEIDQIDLDGGFLSSAVTGTLGFANEEVAITTSVVTGKLRVAWTLDGAAADVTAFFDEMHTKGIAAGVTMADCLDVRDNPTEEPNSTNLPATINPLRFLFENVFRHNCYVVKIKTDQVGEDALPFSNLALLRKLIPPHSAVILYIENSGGSSTVMLDDAGSIE